MKIQRIQPEQTQALRHLVLWPHLASPEVCVIDIDHAEGALHYGAIIEKDIVAIGSFFQTSSPKIKSHHPYRLRAMAVHPDFRGREFGQDLIREACAELKRLHVDTLWCDARLKAVPFYARLGFQALPEVYPIPNIGPHQFMWLNLNEI